MALDHSLTYKRKGLKNILHKRRLKKILNILDSQNLKSTDSYLDVGCSNGYLTNLISKKYGFLISLGVDNDNNNLDIARDKYNHINFEHIDLNNSTVNTKEKYDVITCFETLEHVGDIENALHYNKSYLLLREMIFSS